MDSSLYETAPERAELRHLTRQTDDSYSVCRKPVRAIDYDREEFDNAEQGLDL